MSPVSSLQMSRDTIGGRASCRSRVAVLAVCKDQLRLAAANGGTCSFL